MTEENRRRNALDELERANMCLNEARALYDASFPYGAASRAYYAVFHAATALLMSVGIQAKSHKGIVAMIWRTFRTPWPTVLHNGTVGFPDAARPRRCRLFEGCGVYR